MKRSKLTKERKRFLEKLTVECVVDDWYSYVQMREDDEEEVGIYNDFNDVLFDDLKQEKLTKEEEDYICDYIHTNKFWDALFKEIPEAEGKIMF
ncbi:MAG: hypothetical protein Q7S27_00770 [Nanoarchaeota archaeon]|nr:hypothetical protein [Nanoarchaeota archaeon]